MVVRLLTATLIALVLVPAAGAADKVWEHEAVDARKALDRAVDAGYITPDEQQDYLGILSYAATVRGRVPRGRALVLRNVLAQVARPKSPIAPRAVELYRTLQENASYFDAHPLPRDGTDIVGADGAVYRYFQNQGIEFHPLANAAALNALIAKHDTEAASTLVDALAQRAVSQPDGSLVWEYHFNFGTQRAPWASGLAQAVLAQALARAGNLDLARRAFDAIPGRLDRSLSAGPWIRLYSQSSEVVLNAQLQSAISIGDYAELAGDTPASDYANALLATAKTMLPRFDTGHWSRYSLRSESDLHYQDYVIDLLKAIGKRTTDPAWQAAADRFALYETQPPLLTGPSVTRTTYPLPRDGIRDDLVVRFFLSKISRVALIVDGKAVDGYRWHAGWHTFSWAPAKLGAGTHDVRLAAADLSGNPGSSDLGSFEVVRDRTAPALSAAKAGSRVFWRVKDGESACCRVQLALTRNGERHYVRLSRTHGATTVPKGYWNVSVFARDAAGNSAERPLGLVVGQGP